MKNNDIQNVSIVVIVIMQCTLCRQTSVSHICFEVCQGSGTLHRLGSLEGLQRSQQVLETWNCLSRLTSPLPKTPLRSKEVNRFATCSDKRVTKCPFSHPWLLIPADVAIKEL